jgi:hypothetical protein
MGARSPIGPRPEHFGGLNGGGHKKPGRVGREPGSGNVQLGSEHSGNSTAPHQCAGRVPSAAGPKVCAGACGILGRSRAWRQGWRWPTCSGASRGPIGAGGITRHTVRSFRPVARPRTEGEGEALTEDQEAFQEWAISHGVLHSVSRSVDEALAVLDAWGTLRVKIAVAGLMRAGDL